MTCMIAYTPLHSLDPPLHRFLHLLLRRFHEGVHQKVLPPARSPAVEARALQHGCQVETLFLRSGGRRREGEVASTTLRSV